MSRTLTVRRAKTRVRRCASFGDDFGGLTPLGGTPEMSSHKGYGLGMMAHILGAILCGGALPALREPEGPYNIGHFFLAIDLLHETPPLDPSLLCLSRVVWRPPPATNATDPEFQCRTCWPSSCAPWPSGRGWRPMWMTGLSAGPD